VQLGRKATAIGWKYSVGRARNMININKKEGLKKVGAFKAPSNPLHHSLVTKPGQITSAQAKQDPFTIMKQLASRKMAIDWMADNDVMKALNLDPDKIKIKSMKSKGYDEEYLCIGVGSKQRSGRHILFLDLDNTTKEQAERVAKSLISSVGCSDCYIVQSSEKDEPIAPNTITKTTKSHHLVCMDIFRFKEVQKIAKEFGHDQWAKFRGESKDFVLRIGPKMQVMKSERPNGDVKTFLEEVDGTQPKLVSVIHSPFNYRSKSNSMRRIFSAVWGFNVKKDNGFTDSTMFRFHCYRVRLKRHKDGVDKQVKFEGKPNLKPAVKE